MKTLSTLLGIFLAVSLWVYEVNSGVNLRKGPDNKKKVLTTVPAGKTIEVLEQTNEWWWKVEYQGTEGYIAASFISRSYPKTAWKILATYPLFSVAIFLFLVVAIIAIRKKKSSTKSSKSKKKPKTGKKKS